MFQQTANNIRFFVICALRVNTCKVSVYMVRTFMKCMHACTFLRLKKLIDPLPNYK